MHGAATAAPPLPGSACRAAAAPGQGMPVERATCLCFLCLPQAAPRARQLETAGSQVQSGRAACLVAFFRCCRGAASSCCCEASTAAGLPAAAAATAVLRLRQRCRPCPLPPRGCQQAAAQLQRLGILLSRRPQVSLQVVQLPHLVQGHREGLLGLQRVGTQWGCGGSALEALGCRAAQPQPRALGPASQHDACRHNCCEQRTSGSPPAARSSATLAV